MNSTCEPEATRRTLSRSRMETEKEVNAAEVVSGRCEGYVGEFTALWSCHTSIDSSYKAVRGRNHIVSQG